MLVTVTNMTVAYQFYTLIFTEPDYKSDEN